MYGLEVLSKSIQTIKNNITRFVIVENHRSNKNKHFDKASLKFILNHQRGSLANVLKIMSDFKLNLTFRGMPFQSFDNPFTKHCIKAIKDVTGLEASQDTGGGTSDARFMQEVCPVFEFGTINKTLHKVNECVSIEDLKTTEQIYYKTLENFFDN